MLTPENYDPEKYQTMTTPCRNGHLSLRYLSNGACWACQNTRRSRYRQNGGSEKEQVARRKQYHEDPVAAAKKVRDRRKDGDAARISKNWRLRNPEKVRQYSAKYVRQNRDKKAALAAAYSSRKLKATPIWADLKRIEEVYGLAKQISETTGIPHEVDHIVPLRGKNVCGLHVHYNLRAIPTKENRMKYNKMPSDD